MYSSKVSDPSGTGTSRDDGAYEGKRDMSASSKIVDSDEDFDISVFSGLWEGKSVSNKGDQTFWKGAELTFQLHSDRTHATVSGNGISLWRSYKIPFEVTGTINCRTKEITIVKEHKGQFTNRVEYNAVLVPSRGIVSGDYANGVIVLKFKSERDMMNPEICLSGKWGGESRSRNNDPTTWTETELQFILSGDGVTGHIDGRGLSLWRSMQIEFVVEGTFNWETKEISLRKQHLGRYTNVVNYEGIVLLDNFTIEGEYTNGTIHLERLEDLNLPSAETIRIWTMTDDQKEEVRIREEKGREKASEAREIENLLGGVWGGESIDGEENVTTWRETALKFHLNPVTLKGTIEGQGVSVWREMNIDFNIKGDFDWNTKEIQLHKQHKGRYTNKLVYSGFLRERPPAQGPDADPSRPKWKIEGRYAKGIIQLSKERDLFVLANGNSVKNEGSAKKEVGRPVKIGGGDPHVNLKLAKYEMFLAGMLSSGRQLNASDQLALANFRKKHEVDDEEHWKTVKSMGFEKADFRALMIGESSVSQEDSDTCKICFVEKINAVILPCGHFSLCIDCGKKFMRKHPTGAKCPICRKPVASIQQVYRS